MPDFSDSSERDLLLMVAEGNVKAFKALFEKYHQQLGSYIFCLTDSYEMAEEVVSDVYLKIWTTREKLVNVDSFKAYLFIISRNHAINCLKKLIKEQKHNQKWIEDSNHDTNEDEEADSSDYYYSLIDDAINLLPPQQKKVYLQSRHQRLKYSEIADQMKISRETVKKYLQLATLSISSYVKKNVQFFPIALMFFQFFYTEYPPF